MDINSLWSDYDLNSKKQNSRCLAVNTILEGKYLVGPVLGQGGFGITYIGYDNTLNTPVAIKEYYPSDIAGRTSLEGTVSPYTQTIDDYQKGKQRFLEESRTLAKFADHPCIVGVKDYFDANDTAYMVMEYLEGINLKEYLKRKEEEMIELDGRMVTLL